MPEIPSSNLLLNQPIEAAAPDTQLKIVVDAARPIATGVYQFQLQVVDDSGNVSQPSAVRVVVIDDQAPNAIIDAPDRVTSGQSFTLSGRRSIDVGGTIQRYIWTLIQAP
jgi:chitodextrinase